MKNALYRMVGLIPNRPPFKGLRSIAIAGIMPSVEFGHKLEVVVQTGAATLSVELRGLLSRADGRDMRLGEIIDSFPHRSHILMIVLFSFPMSLPISPPFLGGVFGAVLMFLSFYLVIGRKPWVPQYIHNRLVSFRVMSSTIDKLTWVMHYLEFLLRPRMLFMTNTEKVWRLHGMFLLGMSIILALPIPMPAPFTNSVAALPIFLAALGMMERDGICIIAGYCSTLICIGYYLALILLGKEAFDFLWTWLALGV